MCIIILNHSSWRDVWLICYHSAIGYLGKVQSYGIWIFDKDIRKINTSPPKTHSTQWNKLHHNCAAWSFYWSMLSVDIIVRWLLCDEIPVLVTVVTLRLFLQISTFLHYESRFLQQRNNVSIISTLAVVVVYYSIIFIIHI